MFCNLIEIAFSGFWKFVGVFTIFSVLLQVILNVWTRTMRMFQVRKHGWPPNHLDADGDFLKDD